MLLQLACRPVKQHTPVLDVISEADGGPAAAAAEPVAAGPVVAGDDEAVAIPTTVAHCVGARAVVTEMPALGELVVPVPPWYTGLLGGICATAEDADEAKEEGADEDEVTTFPAVFCKIKVVAVVVLALLRLLTVAKEDTGIRFTPPAMAPPWPLATANGSWISKGWMDIGWPADVAVLVMAPVLGRDCSSRVPVCAWPLKEELEEEGVEFVVVVMSWRIGAEAANAEEVGVLGVE